MLLIRSPDIYKLQPLGLLSLCISNPIHSVSVAGETGGGGGEDKETRFIHVCAPPVGRPAEDSGANRLFPAGPRLSLTA